MNNPFDTLSRNKIKFFSFNYMNTPLFRVSGSDCIEKKLVLYRMEGNLNKSQMNNFHNSSTDKSNLRQDSIYLRPQVYPSNTI
jgi:hypothetical protein